MNKIKNLFIMFFSFLFLVGCGQQSYFIQVNKDDTVNFAAELIITQDVIEKINSLNIQRDEIIKTKEPIFKQVKQNYEAAGFSFTFSESDSEIKVKVQKTYPSIAEFNEDIKNLHKNKKLGLGMGIRRDNGLQGVTTQYNGQIGFMFDPDLIEEIKNNPHLQTYLSNIPITAYLTIYDSDNFISQESMEVGGKAEYKTMITGSWDINNEQPQKDFSLKTENKNEVFAVISFVGIGFVILLLIVLATGKTSKFGFLNIDFVKEKFSKNNKE